jgi:ribose transport system substrate-binding protein
MKPLRALAWLSAVLALPLLLGCPSSSGKPKVAFVSNNPETFWDIAEKGCRKAERELEQEGTPYEVVFRKPDAGDPARQTEIIDNLMNQNIKALAVSVINPSGQHDHLKEVAAKVPLITQDNDAPDTGRLCYIGTNNYKAGRAVGQLIKEAMPDGGTLAVFVGQTEPLNARQRRQGLLDELAGKREPVDINDMEYSPDGRRYGKYRLHKTYTDQPVGAQRATQNATDALTELKREKNLCLIGLWAYNPPAILTAVRDKDLLGKVKIVGFDENDATLQGVADGHIYGTVVQNPFEFGYKAVRLMAQLARGDKSGLPKDGILYEPHRVITKEGGKGRIPVEKFRKDLKAILGQ